LRTVVHAMSLLSQNVFFKSLWLFFFGVEIPSSSAEALNR